MRSVEVSRFVPLQPAVVERALTPENLVRYEGTFEPVDVAGREDGSTVVTAAARGLQARFVFEPIEDGLRYVQAGDEGPFEAMEADWTVEPEKQGVRVTARSSVSLGVPLPAVTDRVAAWKRKRELSRAIDALVADVE